MGRYYYGRGSGQIGIIIVCNNTARTDILRIREDHTSIIIRSIDTRDCSASVRAHGCYTGITSKSCGEHAWRRDQRSLTFLLLFVIWFYKERLLLEMRRTRIPESLLIKHQKHHVVISLSKLPRYVIIGRFFSISFPKLTDTRASLAARWFHRLVLDRHLSCMTIRRPGWCIPDSY